MNKFFEAFIIIVHSTTINLIAQPAIPYQAVVTVPVTDAIGRPIETGNPHVVYHTLPLMTHPINTNIRIHQLLFNEQVTVLEQRNNQLKVAIPNMFYQTSESDTKYNTFWIHHDNVLPVNKVHNAYRILPATIDQHHAHTSTVTLITPFFDPVTQKKYSAGTRFVTAPQQTSDKAYAVFILEPATFCIKQTYIPHQNAIQTDAPGTKRSALIRVLKKWAHPPNSYIPYVWGGCSYINTTHPSFTTCTTSTITTYQRKELLCSPLTGFDCTGLMLRATQIVNIPYYFKNSTTIEKNLPAITSLKHLHPGDLIWYKGHIMVISDVKNGLLIEASGYPSGYGRVHEIPLEKKFHHIHSYQELLDAIKTAQPIYNVDNTGNTLQKLSQVKLLSIQSLCIGYPHNH